MPDEVLRACPEPVPYMPGEGFAEGLSTLLAGPTRSLLGVPAKEGAQARPDVFLPEVVIIVLQDALGGSPSMRALRL